MPCVFWFDNQTDSTCRYTLQLSSRCDDWLNTLPQKRIATGPIAAAIELVNAPELIEHFLASVMSAEVGDSTRNAHRRHLQKRGPCSKRVSGQVSVCVGAPQRDWEMDHGRSGPLGPSAGLASITAALAVFGQNRRSD